MTEPATDYAALFGRNLRAARLHAGLKIAEAIGRPLAMLLEGGIEFIEDDVGS